MPAALPRYRPVIYVRVDRDIHDRLKAECELRNITLTQLVDRAFRYFLVQALGWEEPIPPLP